MFDLDTAISTVFKRDMVKNRNDTLRLNRNVILGLINVHSTTGKRQSYLPL